MTTTLSRISILELFAVASVMLTVSACGSARHEPAAAPTPAEVPPAEAERLAAIARARADSARLPRTEADAEFMTGMIAHHSQAIVMAGWAPSHGASPELQVLAARIINAQHDEIATMQRWLGDQGLPVPEAKPGPMKMKMNGVEHEMLMPGMLTEEQMHQLDQARGEAFDSLFLTFMIQHHKGAVSMVQQLFGSYGAAQDEVVFKFANDVSVDQSTEIARMEKMLAAHSSARPS
ncbi:MAG TPA: DUF305 domain-containing protein [Gemmatimonadales bacterium]|jgi:uncharacterized protein (DUF305 family)|nr:DUF305 domain-containing protein [Gemmatimonadales bacterium]